MGVNAVHGKYVKITSQKLNIDFKIRKLTLFQPSKSHEKQIKALLFLRKRALKQKNVSTVKIYEINIPEDSYR